jgi:PAS domain S-box-containing protein
MCEFHNFFPKMCNDDRKGNMSFMYSITIKPSTSHITNGWGAGIGYQEQPIAETMRNGFFKVDRRWTVKYWNKAAEKILGLSASDMVGTNIWEKFSGIIPSAFFSRYHNAFLQDIPEHFEEFWEEKNLWFDVMTYHFEDTLSVSFKSHSRPAHSSHPDHPEQQLKSLNELYRLVTEITNDCLWEWDIQARQIFWIDGGHKRVFGYQIENVLIPQGFWESHLHPEDKDRVLEGLERAFMRGSGSLWEEEYRFARLSGEYAYVHDRGHIIYEGEKAIRMIGATQDITGRKLAEIELKESRSKLAQEGKATQKLIISAVLTTQENERANIGKELHDNLNQILGAAKLYIELAKTDTENRELCLGKATDYIMNVIEEIRQISKRLGSPRMQIMGLSDSIKMIIDDLVMVHPIKIEFNDEGFDDQNITENLQLDIFRIVQEQLNNILRHANATQASIRLTRTGNEIVLSISDNGTGCDISKEIKGVGIINIKSRAELYHGNVHIVSKPGQGYVLRVVLFVP